MKKWMVWPLLLCMLLGASQGLAQEASLENMITLRAVDPVEDTIGVQAGTELVVGTTTTPTGKFFTELWGTNSADMDVRRLLHGYSTISWLRSEGVLFDGTAVAGSYVRAGEDGSREYIISLMTDLVYNDGTPITAKDYVFSLLLQCSAEIAALGGTPRGLQHLVGYEAYQSGETKGFSGIRLVSEDTFILEVKADYLPFFYGLAMLDVTPYPMHVIAPGCDVYDSGDGAYIAAKADLSGLSAETLGFTPGEFSREMLTKTLLDPATGYLYNPQVTSGPYTLDSYDADAYEATLILNPLYLGNYEGQQPHIEKLVFRKADPETMLDALIAGEYGLLNKVGDRKTIDAVNGLLTSDSPTIAAQNYLRSGLSFLAFACERDVVSSAAVRTAFAHCVDKEKLLGEEAGAYGMPVHGYYGLGQWMTNYATEADASTGVEAVDIMEEVDLLAIPYDVEAAKALLAADGWTLNASGGEYVAGTGDIRYKNENGAMIPLTIKWAKTQGNQTADMIEQVIMEPLREAGIGLEVTEIPFDEVLSQYYRQTERTHDLFFLASNFLEVFDPFYEYNTDDAYQGLVNTSGLKDEQLMALAKDMRETNQMELYEYVTKWLAFQRRWVEQMPMVPLYSNVYFDLMAHTLQGYDIAANASWADAILYAWIGEPSAAAETREMQTIDDM